jgi:hypothetical protein
MIGNDDDERSAESLAPLVLKALPGSFRFLARQCCREKLTETSSVISTNCKKTPRPQPPVIRRSHGRFHNLCFRRLIRRWVSKFDRSSSRRQCFVSIYGLLPTNAQRLTMRICHSRALQLLECQLSALRVEKQFFY